MKDGQIPENLSNVFEYPEEFDKNITKEEFEEYIKFDNKDYSIVDVINAHKDGSLFDFDK